MNSNILRSTLPYTLINLLKDKASLSEHNIDCLLGEMVRVELKKGDQLVKPNQVCNNIYFIEKGVARIYYLKNEKKVTDWLETEHQFITIVDSFLNNTPSKKYLDVLEDSVLWSLKNSTFEKLSQINPEIQKFGRMVLHQTLVMTQERFDDLHFITARQRYEKLMHKSSDLLQRVPLYIIASYLCISQETLSRVRAKY
jgi:CRP-like cAMP-binding protein